MRLLCVTLSVVLLHPWFASPTAQEATNSAARPGFEDYVFPPLMRALFTNEFVSVPDTQLVRGYYTSIGVVFNQTCAPPNDYTALAFTSYLSGDARALIRNPNDPSRIGRILVDLLRNPAGTPLRLLEGEEDARAFLDKYPCTTPQAQRLRANLHKLVHARKDTPVEPANDARLIALMNPAYRASHGIEVPPVVETPVETTLAACQDWRVVVRGPQEAEIAFCRCIAPKLVARLDATKRAALVQNFDTMWFQLIETEPKIMTYVLEGCAH